MPSMRRILPIRMPSRHWQMSCQRRAYASMSAIAAIAHIRVITLISGRRCQGRPTTKASNCAWVSDSGVGSPLLARPHEASGVQPPRGAPHAEAVVHQQLDARGARVGEQVAVVGVGRAGVCTTQASSRSAPARMSIGAVHSHSRSMRITSAAPWTVRAARPRSRRRPSPASARARWTRRA